MQKLSAFIYSIRLWIYVQRQNYFRENLKKRILKFMATPEGKPFETEGNFISQYGLAVFPYSFAAKYDKSKVELESDEEYPFFNYRGKNLYLPNSMTQEKAKGYANDILMEQDEESPHSYKNPLFSPDAQDVLLDIGCGDANFSLEQIETVKKVFLFESDPKWVIPIEKTFRNWDDKVVFFNKRFGFDSLDLSKMEELYTENVLLKIDVDGAERQVLKVIETLLPKLKSVKVAICTYHQNSDASEFDNWFKSRGFETCFGNGYMLFHYDQLIEKPYFRPGVLFAYRHQ